MAKTHKARKAAPPPPPSRSGGPPIFLIGVGVVIVLGIVAVLLTRGGSDEAPEESDPAIEQVRAVEVTGESLPKFGDEPDAAVGATAPSVTGKTFDGAVTSIGGSGEPQLVVFLAHWCPHCQKEVPVITTWIEDEGAPDGVQLRAVSTSVNPDAPNYPPSAWLARERWPLRTVADDDRSTVAAAFGLSGFPYFVAIDGDGKIVARASGELSVEQIEALVEKARAAS